MIVYSLRPKQIAQRQISASKPRKGISLSVTHKHYQTPIKKIDI